MRNILVLGMSAFIQDLEVTVLTEDVEDIDFAYATSVETATDLLDKGQWDEFLIFADFLESLDLSTIDVPVTSYKLKNAYQIHYESELKYLHDAMLPPMRCELYYWYYIFRKQFNEDKKIYQKETEIGKGKRNAVNSKGEKRKPRQKRSNTGKKTGTGTDQDLP